MRIAKSILIWAGWLSGCIALAGASGVSISGVVVDGKGTPIAGASVLYRSVQTVTQSANGQRLLTGPVATAGLTTASDGTFSVSGLPAATYHLCAYGVKANHLGSCEWSLGTMHADLADGQAVQVTLVVAEGTLLTFQVADPRNQIKDLESLSTPGGRVALSGANFGIGVWAGTRYARATLVSTSGATREYQLAIPKTATVRLFLDTSLGVADATGSAIPVGQPSMTLAAGGQAEVITNLTIQ
jgi:hypothetical protein